MGKRDCKQPSWVVERRNRFTNYMLYFENLASTIVTWGGLPRELRSGWIERRLFNDGQLLAFSADWKKEQYDGLLFLPLAHRGQLNVYGELTEYEAISPMRTFKRNYNNSVLIRNNELRTPTVMLITPLVWELVDIEMTIKVNRNSSCKTPIIARANDRTQLTALNMVEEMLDNKPVIIRDSNLEETVIDSLKVAEYHGTELMAQHTWIFNQILTHLGIISNPVVKAERVNTIEATSNRGLLVDETDSRLIYRKEAVERINEMFSEEIRAYGATEITCEINNIYLDTMIEQGMLVGDGGLGGGNKNVEDTE